jgi:hypothetical protein
MNEDQNPIEIIQILPKYVQALYSDGVLYFSGEPTIATQNRKATLLNDIAMIKTVIEVLEKIMGEHGQQ